MGLLETEEIIKVCQIAQQVGVDFVKTSTGFNNTITSPADIAYLKSILPRTIKIKASGGIRTKEEAVAMIKAGADRIGTSSGLRIIANN